MKKICYVATIPEVVHAFLRGHVQTAALSHEVTVVCSAVGSELIADLPARLLLLPIERKPKPWRDAQILFQLYRLFRRERFDIVHSIMPKTGLLAMLAAWLARVPVRIHTFTGQVWVTRHGVQRILLKWFDRQIGRYATCALADSPSQRDFLVREGVLTGDRAQIIGAGSICGVDLSRFRPDPAARRAIRTKLKIADDAKVVLFIGRLNRDKGLLDLAAAFASLASQDQHLVLILVGAEEDVTFDRIREICGEQQERLRYAGFSSTPEHYMAAADILCLPSYREGFGQVIIEAAACRIPAVASRIYGITDAVADGKTGLLVPAGDTGALVRTMSRMLADATLRKAMGEAARARATELFSAEKIAHETMVMYDRLSAGKRSKNG